MFNAISDLFKNTSKPVSDVFESPDGGQTIYVRKANQQPSERTRVIIKHDDPFIEELINKGFKFSISNSWYSRRWYTNNNTEFIEEIYEKSSNDNWKHVMIRDDEKRFYEEPVDKVAHKGVGKDLDAL